MQFIGPKSSLLACGDVGKGSLESTDVILEKLDIILENING